MKFEIKNKEGFLDEFLAEFLLRSFGSLPKREIDILVMHLILKHAELSSKSNHELSILFQISETRIKTLRHEGQLRYIKNADEYIRENFFKVLKKSQFQSEQKKLLFAVEDSYLKQGIQARLKALGHFADNSFNSEIVKISPDSFAALMESIYSEEEREQFENEINAVLSGEDKIKFKPLLKKFLESAAGRAGEKTVDIGAIYLTGGTSEIANFSDTVRGLFSSD